MRIIEPVQLNRPLRKRRRSRFFIFIVLIVLLAGYSLAAALKPLPAAHVAGAVLTPPSVTAPALVWPARGQAALGAVGYGVLAQSGAQTKAPIASVAKVMTALVILHKKPLKVGEQGPLITLDSTDVQYYNDYVARGGSVVPVIAGEQISEYQALQALLLPSANNMAVSLSRWAFGSEEAFVVQANQLASSLGMIQTHIADASGFSAQTLSTPHDLVLLALSAVKNPVINEIIGQKTAVIPVAGEIRNTNWLLGSNGIDGIKTGNTGEAGGCYLFAATQKYGSGPEVRLVGAVMGAPDLNTALHDGRSLLASAIPGFQNVVALRRGQVVGHYTTVWGETIAAKSKDEVSLLVWSGAAVKFKSDLQELFAPVSQGAVIGHLTVQTGGMKQSVPLIADGSLQEPTLGWRLTHYF